MQSIAIIILCVGSAIGYGVIHDQITARVCVEYFTVFHSPIGTDNPTLLGLYWGVTATWWVGVLLGVPLAIAARAGGRPKRDIFSMARPIAILLAVMATMALVAGLVGWLLAERGVVFLVEPMATRVPAEKHVAFLVDLWAHSASYFIGFVGGIVVIVNVWRSRANPGNASLIPGLDSSHTHQLKE